jgi:hypothetical protein
MPIDVVLSFISFVDKFDPIAKAKWWGRFKEWQRKKYEKKEGEKK